MDFVEESKLISDIIAFTKHSKFLYPLMQQFSLQKINDSGRRVVLSRPDISFVIKYFDGKDIQQNENPNLLEYKRSKIANPNLFAKVIKRFGNYIIQEKCIIDKERAIKTALDLYGYNCDELGLILFDILDEESSFEDYDLNSKAKNLYFECRKILFESFDIHSKNWGFRENGDMVIIDYGETVSPNVYKKLLERIEK